MQQAETADLLVVANHGNEYEIPFAKAYVVRVELAARRVEMDSCRAIWK